VDSYPPAGGRVINSPPRYLMITNKNLSSDRKSIFTVYALYSANYDKIYIGYSSNLQARLAAHNAEKGKEYMHLIQIANFYFAQLCRLKPLT